MVWVDSNRSTRARRAFFQAFSQPILLWRHDPHPRRSSYITYTNFSFADATATLPVWWKWDEPPRGASGSRMGSDGALLHVPVDRHMEARHPDRCREHSLCISSPFPPALQFLRYLARHGARSQVPI